MIAVTVFLQILNQIDFHLVQNRKETWNHDHIPFNVKGNEMLVFSALGRNRHGVLPATGAEGRCKRRCLFIYVHRACSFIELVRLCLSNISMFDMFVSPVLYRFSSLVIFCIDQFSVNRGR